MIIIKINFSKNSINKIVKFIKNNIIKIMCVLFAIVIGLIIFEGIYISNLKKNIELKEEKVRVLESKYKDINRELSETQVWLNFKNSRIEKLEEENERYKKAIEEYEALSLPDIDRSKKTYMDYCCIGRNSKQGSVVYADEAWTDEDGLRR